MHTRPLRSFRCPSCRSPLRAVSACLDFFCPGCRSAVSVDEEAGEAYFLPATAVHLDRRSIQIFTIEQLAVEHA